MTSQSKASSAAFGRLARRPEAGSFLGMVTVFVFFAIFGGAIFLSPSGAAEPGIVDVSTEEPWASLRGPEFPPCT